MDFNYDILTTVIDTNVSIGEILDLPCKNIFLHGDDSFLSFIKPTKMPDESTTLENRP